MNMSAFTFVLLTLISSFVLAQTIIPGGSVSGTWTLAGSPYLVQGEIQIPDNYSLLIEPGVTVEFQGHYSLNVQGRLLAIGTETDSILFTIHDTTGFADPDTALGGWNGIRFIDTPATNDSSKIVYCRLQYGKAVGNVWHANAGGAICVIQFDKVVISHCLFIDNSAGGLINEGPAGGAVHFAFSDIRLTENIFRFNQARLGGAIHFHDSSPTSMMNIIEYNRAYQGGGIVVEGNCRPVFNQDVLRYNHADDRGGGIVCWSPSISIFNNVAITHNTSWWGAGMGVYDSEIFLNNCQVSDNRAENLGGGIHADFSTLHLYQTTIQRDTSDSGSGGVHAWHCEVEADLCQFSDNTAIKGGAFHSDFSQVEIRRSNFSRNIATNGAGIDAYCIDLLLDSCDFVQNVAYNAAASIQYNADTTEFSQPYQVALTRNRFELNYTPNLVGGITINQFNSDSSLVDLLVDNCIFASNSADHAASFRIMGSIHNFIVSNSIFTGNDALRWAAGPFLIVKCRGEFINCLFSENQSSVGGGTSSGGGAALSQEAQVDFINCTFVNNSSGMGGGLDIRTGGTACVMNSIFWDNTNQQISITTTDSRISSLTINNCNIQNGLDSIGVDTSSIFQWGDGNIDADPLFVHPAGADYHLQDGSPCIGAGIDSLEMSGIWYLAPSCDLDGNPRPNPAGSMPDMGAYESPLAAPLGILGAADLVPEQFHLLQNYPNPFNPSTKIQILIPNNEFVTLKVYNILGEEMAVLVSESLTAGVYDLVFSASDLPSGVYLYRLRAGDFVETRKMLLIR